MINLIIKTMDKKQKVSLKGLLMILMIMIPVFCSGQNERQVIKGYLTKLPVLSGDVKNLSQRFMMSALYTNMDKFGIVNSRTMVSGEFTRGLSGGRVKWNNVFIYPVNKEPGKSERGKRAEYMENFTYIPSDDMLNESSFASFPVSTENVFARNLVWDMMALENFAWRYCDSLMLNRIYIIPGSGDAFDMGKIGSYKHDNVQLCWTGISQVDNNLCAIIEFRALNNIIEINMSEIKTKGTEQYWGTIWLSLKTGQIMNAEMYGGTIQEIEVSGLKDKFLIKTVRELKLNRIQ
jgi:hypothetical protein